jgi:protein-S-isoprenylcysteine O-methyltransferase Ste14
MKVFKQWAARKYPLALRIMVLVLAGLIFAILIPSLLLVALPRLDAALGVPLLYFGLVNLLIGAFLIVAGFIFAAWSILSQVILANGTPVPVMPTQKLLVVGPFKHCRNPMVFGTVTAYLGCSILAGSLLSVVAVILFATLLVVYIKRIEEKELEARFGQEYLDYKQRTPFIIPGFIRSKGKN